MFCPQLRQLGTRARKPFFTPRLNELIDARSMSGKQRRTDIKAGFMQISSKQPESLRRVPKTMQEENPNGIPLLHVYCFSTGYDAGLTDQSRSRSVSVMHCLLRKRERRLSFRYVRCNISRKTRRRDHVRHPPARRDPGAHQPAQCECDRLPCCSHHFAQQSMMLQLEPESPI